MWLCWFGFIRIWLMIGSEWFFGEGVWYNSVMVYWCNGGGICGRGDFWTGGNLGRGTGEGNLESYALVFIGRPLAAPGRGRFL